MNYTFILSEKRDAAERISKALDDDGQSKHFKEEGLSYFEAIHNGEKLIIVPTSGHLFTIASERIGQFYYPVFNVEWKPNYSNRSTQIKKWIDIISKIAKDASAFISATDYDIEGEVIGYTIFKYGCQNKENQAKRMTFSTLTKAELRRAFEHSSPHLLFKLAEAGETRHIVDFLWGINLSRAITLAAENWSGKHIILSTGRIQAPTLRFLVNREKDIQSYVPMLYWEIHMRIKVQEKFYNVEYEKNRVDDEAEAKRIVEDCFNEECFVEDIETRIFQQSPPTPFDLGTLQTEAYKLFGYTPSRTLNIAERLYLDALISYPRTSSQKIPPQINCLEIFNSLKNSREYSKLIKELLEKKELRPNEGKLDDSAHPCIYPTGNLPDKPLLTSHWKLFDLIVKRFMATFSTLALKKSIKVSLKVKEHIFYLFGRQVINSGWLKFYKPYNQIDEIILPTIIIGQRLPIVETSYEEKYTSPPPRYNPASLLKLMDEEHLGTKATRAEIIDTLYQRKYIQDERIAVTELGFNVIEILENFSSGIISAKFTRNLEDRMEKIEKGEEKKENVLLDAVEKLRDILEEFKIKEESIGEELSNAVGRARLEDLIVGQCPICKTGNLLILHSRKTGKRFVGCSNFVKGLCKTSFRLPQPPYIVKPLKKLCKVCQWPIVVVISKKKRPWTLCLNPNCAIKRSGT